MAGIDYKLSVAVDTVLADADAVQIENFDGGRIYVPTGSAITSITWYDSHDGTTYIASYDGDNVAITTTVAAARSYPIPPDLNAARYFKMVGDADGTVHVIMKKASVFDSNDGD